MEEKKMSRWEIALSILFMFAVAVAVSLALADACTAPAAYSSFRGGGT